LAPLSSGRHPSTTAAFPRITDFSPKNTASDARRAANAAVSRRAKLAAKLLSAANTCCLSAAGGVCARTGGLSAVPASESAIRIGRIIRVLRDGVEILTRMRQDRFWRPCHPERSEGGIT
jgi:hypothetical protein